MKQKQQQKWKADTATGVFVWCQHCQGWHHPKNPFCFKQTGQMATQIYVHPEFNGRHLEDWERVDFGWNPFVIKAKYAKGFDPRN